MKLKASTTRKVRLAAVVKACGRPTAVNLWIKPSENKEFMRAVDQCRVMSVKQGNVGNSPDYGLVGFIKARNTAWLIFPKPLTDFENARIIGIKYDLIDSAERQGARVTAQKAPKARHSRISENVFFGEEEPASRDTQHESHSPARAAAQFQVRIRFQAQIEQTVTVEAKNQSKAKAAALEKITRPDFSGATVTRKVVSVKRS